MGLITGLIYWWGHGRLTLEPIVDGLILGLVGGLIFELFHRGLDAIQIQESRQLLVPNQVIRNAWHFAFRTGVLSGLLVGVLLWLIFRQSRDSAFALNFGLIGALAMGLSVLQVLSEAVIWHYTLRWLLAQQNILPFPFRDKRLVTFLDSMVDRILLRRAGGGYLFVHRALLEHFAAQSPCFVGKQGD